MDTQPIRVTVWNENIHDRSSDHVRTLYPNGIHGAVASAITESPGAAVTVRTATLDQPDCGLPPVVLDDTDVLTWWGHVGHSAVDDGVVDRVCERVLQGMGFVALHSAHLSKPLRRLLGTSCSLRWREADDRELVWTVDPSHPVAAGIPSPVTIDRQEMYGEFFDIPPPDELVFVSSFSGGEVFRSGCGWRRGRGRIFYFSPGHETHPVYHQPDVRRIIGNAVRWAHNAVIAPVETAGCPRSPTGWYDA